MSAEVFDRLLERALAHLERSDIFTFDGFAGASPQHGLPIRVVTERAWQCLFARTLFIRPTAERAGRATSPAFTVIQAGSLPAGGAAAGVRSDTFIGIDFDRGLVLVLGTEYAGEVKKSIFSVMNYLLPRQGHPHHALLGQRRAPRDDAALFFGLSGTGKTTLSADPNRALIGDDETGWGDEGIFNLEGGCYAKCINLSQKSEPQIWDAIRFGSVMENVVIDPVTRVPDFADARYTENTRASYPLFFIPGARLSGHGAAPAQRDLPHRRRLRGAAAGGPAEPRPGHVPLHLGLHRQGRRHRDRGHRTQGDLLPLLRRARSCPCTRCVTPPCWASAWRGHGAQCWLVNTGWSGGPYGVGQRMKIEVSRAVITAILSGELATAPTDDRPGVRHRGPPGRARASPPSSCNPAAPGPTRPPTTHAPARWPTCSVRTSPCTPRAAAPRSGPPDPR